LGSLVKGKIWLFFVHEFWVKNGNFGGENVEKIIRLSHENIKTIIPNSSKWKRTKESEQRTVQWKNLHHFNEVWKKLIQIFDLFLIIKLWKYSTP
jgi:hypothetical protein